MYRLFIIVLLPLFFAFFCSCNALTPKNPSTALTKDSYNNLWLEVTKEDAEQTLQHKIQEAFLSLKDNKKRQGLYLRLPHEQSNLISFLKELKFEAYRINDDESVWIYRNGRAIPDQANMLAGMGVALFNQRGELLLVRNRGVKVWHLPGGAVDAHELNIYGAIREVKEELNLKIEVDFLKTVAFTNRLGKISNQETNGIAHYFLYTRPIKESQIKLDEDEIDEMTWANLQDIGPEKNIKGFSFIPFLKDFIHQLNPETSRHEAVFLSPTSLIQTLKWN